jgi:hypothetical protein
MTINVKARLAIAAVILFTVHLWIFSLNPYAYGMDGYYYAAQIKSYWEKGRFFSKDVSPILYAMTYFSRLGSDIVFMNKIFVALLAAFMVWPAWLFMRNLVPRRDAFVATLVLSSCVFAALFKLTFVKNYGALGFLLLFLNSLFRIQKNKTLGQIAFAGLWFVLCLLSHKLTAGVAVLTLVLFLGLHGRKFLLPALVLVPVFILFALFSAKFANLLHLADLVRIHALFQTQPVFPPAAFAQSFKALRWIGVESWIFFLVSLAGMGILVRIHWRRKRRRRAGLAPRYAVIGLLLVLAANPFYSYASDELGFRMHLLIMLPGTFFLVLLFRLIKPLRLLRPRNAGQMAGFAISAGLLCLYLPVSLLNMQRADQIDYAAIAKITDELKLPENHLLIVHQGFDYYYCYRRRGDAFHFLPEPKHAGRPQYRLAYGIPPRHFAPGGFFHADSQVRRMNEVYTLLPEATWNQFLDSLPVKQKHALLTWRNPHRFRDAYLREKDRL